MYTNWLNIPLLAFTSMKPAVQTYNRPSKPQTYNNQLTRPFVSLASMKSNLFYQLVVRSVHNSHLNRNRMFKPVPTNQLIGPFVTLVSINHGPFNLYTNYIFISAIITDYQLIRYQLLLGVDSIILLLILISRPLLRNRQNFLQGVKCSHFFLLQITTCSVYSN